ncbi:MAG: hypothetical protein FJ405_16835 [Verrucomicrobia bacterium]|nr:hypothetical protein [Verrucomicrobiota bacterium]
MADSPSKKSPKKKSALIGVGLDSDGHKRITRGPNFAMVGGTQDTHDEMVEKALKINEKLQRRGKQLEDVSREEFNDIAHEVGLKPVAVERPSNN